MGYFPRYKVNSARRRAATRTSTVLAAFILLSVSACGNNGRAADAPQPIWIFSDENLAAIQRGNPSLAAKILTGPSTYVVTIPGTTIRGAQRTERKSVPTELFTSYSAFTHALERKEIGIGIRAVAYDPEHWSATPLNEQRNPLRYLELFSHAARQHGYTPILMPGRDLLLTSGSRCTKQQGETLDTAFIRCDIAEAARFTPVFEIQCAPIELNTSELSSFLRASARQARAANPSVTLTATLSTAPGGKRITAQQLLHAAKAMAPYVRGFQLNVSQGAESVEFAFLSAVARRPLHIG